MNNQYFISIGKKERKAAIILVLFHLFVMVISSLVTVSPPYGMDPEVFELLFNAVYQGVMIMIIALFMKEYMRRAWQNISAQSKGAVFGAVMLGILFIYAVSVIANIFSFSINGLGKIAVNQKMLQEFLGHYPFAIILLAVAGAFTEEVIYRGILFEFFYKAGQTASVLLTAFLFGFIHILSTIKLGDFNGILDLILKLLPYFMMGLALALEYVKYKNIWINVFTHVLWNIIACLMSIVVMKFLPFMK